MELLKAKYLVGRLSLRRCLTFIEWMTEVLDTRGIHIAIDGKALRGGNIVLTVKKSSPLTYKELKNTFQTLEEERERAA